MGVSSVAFLVRTNLYLKTQQHMNHFNVIFVENVFDGALQELLRLLNHKCINFKAVFHKMQK